MVYNLTKIATPSDNFNPESRSVLATYISAKRLLTLRKENNGEFKLHVYGKLQIQVENFSKWKMSR